jgi:glycine cleavage system H protein
MSLPENRKYTKDHEWALKDGDTIEVGITDYAQDSLGDVVYLELPDIGKSLQSGDTFGVVESVKAASDLYAPIEGEVVEVNDELAEEPEKINADPYGSWMIKLKCKDEKVFEDLMDAQAYKEYLDSID